MQLPRGTFREIKKKTQFGGLLEELQQTRFTGICTISFGAANGIIVFKSGKRILVEFQNICGDAAWEDLQKIVEEDVGVSLSTLNDAQIQLSLEYNKSCRIVKGGKTESSSLPVTPSIQHQPVTKSHPTPPKPADDVLIKNHQKPGLPEWASQTQSVPFEHLHQPEQLKKKGTHHITKSPHQPSAAIPQQPPVHAKVHTEKADEKKTHKEEILIQEDSNLSNFDNDIEAIETMDVEAMTKKIQGECKTILKQLHLEHLTDR